MRVESAHTGGILTLAATAAGIVSGGEDGKVRVWRAGSASATAAELSAAGGSGGSTLVVVADIAIAVRAVVSGGI